ncbi:MAG: hypothetical protein V2A58_11490 [Planctomycetota bacterium]
MATTIAILTSTRPVCRDVQRPGGGIAKRAIDPRACAALAQKFDLVIIGSAASDKVYDRIAQNVTGSLRPKFRFYSKTYFDKFAGSAKTQNDEELDAGWKQILKTNKIFFLTDREVVNEDFSTSFEKFDWRKIRQFLSDERVTVITAREQFMPREQ